MGACPSAVLVDIRLPEDPVASSWFGIPEVPV